MYLSMRTLRMAVVICHGSCSTDLQGCKLVNDLRFRNIRLCWQHMACRSHHILCL